MNHVDDFHYTTAGTPPQGAGATPTDNQVLPISSEHLRSAPGEKVLGSNQYTGEHVSFVWS